jgi:hypothetical protein
MIQERISGRMTYLMCHEEHLLNVGKLQRDWIALDNDTKMAVFWVVAPCSLVEVC